MTVIASDSEAIQDFFAATVVGWQSDSVPTVQECPGRWARRYAPLRTLQLWIASSLTLLAIDGTVRHIFAFSRLAKVGRRRPSSALWILKNRNFFDRAD
jgi:hypothetical protein